jgi:hypothetical protein
MNRRRLREMTGAGLVLSTVVAGTGRADAAQPQDGEQVEDVLEVRDTSIARARLITSLEGWPGVRSIWRELDLLEPGDNGYSFGVIDWDQANLMREKLNSLYYEMAGELEAMGESGLELKQIADITRMRIEMMSSGMPSMMTRMMPPPIDYDKGALLQEMERKIDHLLDLRDQGLLGIGQVRRATGEILDTFVAVSILETVSATYGYPYMMYDLSMGYSLGSDLMASDSAMTATEMADMVLEQMERHYQSLTGEGEVPEYLDPDEVRASYEECLDAIEAVRGTVTGTGYLLGDLLLGAD